MNYCALDDAFPSMSAPSPGCAANDASKTARKEERRKARRCKGPAATYLNLESESSAPAVPVMNSESGMKEHAPVTAPQGDIEAFLPEETASSVPPISQAVLSAQGQRKSFFGADPDSESFADYAPDAQDYRLQPDFQSSFQQVGVNKPTGTLPNPSVNMYWKPLSRGAQTAFVEHLPPGGYGNKGDVSMGEVMTKLDKLFARLDDMNASSPEQVTSELLMFISSGIFVLFFMDLLVKKASTMRF